MNDWKEVVVRREMPLTEAIAKIDRSGLQLALVLNSDKTLAGVLSDGDVRRAILGGKSLDISVAEVMNPQPTVALASMPRSKMLGLMRRLVIHHLPLVNATNQVVGLATLDDLIGAVERPNWVVLMAGGLGTRLHPLTKECPKPLLKVGGKPILEIILESFAEQGFKHIFLSVNYKAEMIQDYFGEGDRWGVQLNYIHEKERLGTAGALSLLPEHPTTPMIVMNGDILTRTSFDSLLKFHEAQDVVATMAVREYDFQVPYGVVRMNGSKIEAIEEKPVQHFFVNAGIYALSPKVLDYLPEKAFFDMPTLFERLMAVDLPTAAYPLREYWLDIGRISDLEKANQQIGTLIE
ncbi:nucleotidyltransferase family protein [Laspinema olomoucense]|uniref:nucleotidyltransferase family protein n=1 Tax=Laspinema olomoucense TaxID=3231600 RepID=UPI0021BAF633|nr:nucleotidyltransferase family protein [Laspinema sp. D3c]MCT7995230.1 nucleotidyltransferase family protein [Laspinema sp. D3c]